MLARRCLESGERLVHLGAKAAGELVALEVGAAESRADREPRRDRNPERRHFREAGPLAAKQLFHRGGAVGPALAEKPDQRRGVGTAHTDDAVRGET